MNKREAFKNAKEVFPGLKPTRAGGFVLSDDGKGVIVACHDEKVSLVLHNETDISRLLSCCQMALKARENASQ